MFKILLAEDDKDMNDLVAGVLRETGYQVVTAGDGETAISLLFKMEFDLVVTDIKMPRATGMSILTKVQKLPKTPPVILITAFGSIDSAVQAMKEGAYYYLTKPFRMTDLLEIVEGALNLVVVQKEFYSNNFEKECFFPVIFKSKVMQNLMKLLSKVSDSETSILIQGESGTGKELVAKEIRRLSSRNIKPMVALDCSSIPETLLESELFGHIKGSFTGAVCDKQGLIIEANTGTLFLDEISNIPITTQAKLLRFLQERKIRKIGSPNEIEIDVRIISASNQDLKEMISRREFRDDLYYRLAVIPIYLPPLRERREDIAPMVYHFIRKFDQKLTITGLQPQIMDVLISYDWPGNVRELENVIERAVVLRKEGMITINDLPPELLKLPQSEERSQLSLEEIEQHHIEKMLLECNNNQSQVARILGIDRRTLYRKIKKYEIKT